jgi:hypothetical protein
LGSLRLKYVEQNVSIFLHANDCFKALMSRVLFLDEKIEQA